jgi:hypothetical protein
VLGVSVKIWLIVFKVVELLFFTEKYQVPDQEKNGEF